MMLQLMWQQTHDIPSKSYICGYCGNSLASAKGWVARSAGSNRDDAFVYLCHYCSRPTFVDLDGNQTPGVVFGNSVQDIPDSTVQALYNEARKTTGIGGYTAAVLCCRKMLMHIAVSKGATPGKNFIDYVQYLTDNHYVPPDAKDWVDHIRKKGNEANHEIVIMTKDDATELLSFIEMLLKMIFEFPAAIKKKTVANAGKSATP